MSRAETWQNSIWNDMIDDDDADSDTDSRLSGSVVVDSVMRRLQRGYGGDRNGVTLDPIADQSLDDNQMDGYIQRTHPSNGAPPNRYGNQQRMTTTNGSHYSPSRTRHHAPRSPKSHPRYIGNFNGGGANMGVSPRRDNPGLLHPYTSRRKDQFLLSPVPENLENKRNFVTSDFTTSVMMSSSYTPASNHPFSHGNPTTAGFINPTHHSMENVQTNRRFSPTLQRPSPDGYRSPPISHSSNSPDGNLSRSYSEHTKMTTTGIIRRGSMGSNVSPYHQSMAAVTRSPQLSSRIRHNYSHQDILEHQVAGLGNTSHQFREPNLNDVVDYLSSHSPQTVAKAASYLQHLAYNDDSMKAKIRQFGGIQALVSQVCNNDVKVQISVLGALRNLSYGRANNDSKIQIANDAGLSEMSYLLKSTQQSEVRELVTNVLWNLSSCEEIKVRLIQSCLKDMVDVILLPHSGYNETHIAARDFSVRPSVRHWSPEMRNSLGALRNISSAGEDGRRYLRRASGLINSLVWVIRAATGQENADEKTAENAVCILRNLSFQIEDEIDPQEGADDVLDKEWERAIQQEIEDLSENNRMDRKKKSSFVLLCARPRTTDNTRRTIPRLSQPHNLANPDSSVLPKRVQPVMGVALLWQPEMVFPYLAMVEKYGSSPDLIEGAVGAIQNLTACKWKWAEYQRHMVGKVQGLTLLIELLNHAHDTVVRTTSTALRNLSLNRSNRLVIGTYAIQGLIQRLPYGQNFLGISEETTISMLSTITELCSDNEDFAKVFRDTGAIAALVRLTHSREHTPNVILSAHKLCSVLYESKVTKSFVKQEGWDVRDYHRLMEESNQLELVQSSDRHYQRGKGNEPKIKKMRSNNEPLQQPNNEQQKEQPNPLHNLPAIIPKLSVPSIMQEAMIEPNYQLIPDAPNATAASTVQPPATTSSTVNVVVPVSMYAEINDPEIEQVRKQTSGSDLIQQRSDSRTHSRTGSQPHSETRGTPTDMRTNGSLTPHEALSGDEMIDQAVGNEMYAQVDYIKKREDRMKRKELQEQLSSSSLPGVTPMNGVDSWV